MDYFLNGTSDNYIDRLCAAMEYVDKEWAGKVVPAATEQIERLCNLAGISGKPLKLPEAYLAYLILCRRPGSVMKSEAVVLGKRWQLWCK